MEQMPRPQLPTPKRSGTRSFAFALCLPIYLGVGVGVVGLSRSEPCRLRTARSQTVIIQESDDFAPPPLSLGPTASPTTAQSSIPPTVPEEAPPALPMEPIPIPAVTTSAGLSGSGSPGPSGGGAEGGIAGGIVGGTQGGTPGSVLLPPRFDAGYLQNPPPEYPASSKRQGEEGRVLLRVLVGPEGRPQDLEIKSSSGFARLDQAALHTVRRWRFVPARQGVTPVPAWVIVPIAFHLDA